MNGLKTPRSTLFLAMASAMTLSGCVVQSGGPDHVVDPPPPPPPVYAGCPSLQGTGASGIIPLGNYRGAEVSIESYIFPDSYIRHRNGRGEVSFIRDIWNPDDAVFIVVPGLADNRCISFESVNYPDHFLTQDGTNTFLDRFVSNNLDYAEDATFCPRPGLADARDLSFETCNYPDSYLNVYNNGLFVDDGFGLEFDQDATFLLTPPL
ncbi:MAG: AbfB domain-containing protein [Cystobacter sp.]